MTRSANRQSPALRILEVTASYLPKVNGTTVTVRNLREGLSARGHTVSVVTRWRYPSPREELDGMGRIIRVGQGRGRVEGALFPLLASLTILGIARRHGVDVIHAHGLSGALAAVPTRIVYRVPFLLTFHQLPGFTNPTEHGVGAASYRVLSPLLLRFVCGLAGLVTAQSDLLADLYTKELRLDPRRVVVVPNPIIFPKTAGQASPGGVRVLFVGNLGMNKGVDTLIRAMARVLTQHPDAKLVVVGQGPQRDSLSALAEQLGIAASVEFLGAVGEDRIPSVYLASTVLVLPSVSESFGLVLAEALSFGVPVVATRTLGARSIVRHMETGLLVQVGDPESLADAILWVVDNPEDARQMARRGRESVRAFDLDVVSATLEEALIALRGKPGIRVTQSDSRYVAPLHNGIIFRGVPQLYLKILSVGVIFALIILSATFYLPGVQKSASTSPSSPGVSSGSTSGSGQTGTGSKTTSSFSMITPASSGYGPLPSGGQFVVPFPTYSWGNYGYCNAVITPSCGPDSLTDAEVQQGYLNIGNEIVALFPQNLNGWGQGANTTSGNSGAPTNVADLTNPGYIYSPATGALISKYQIPYFMAGVLDGYGAAGNVNNNDNWVNYAITQFPALMTYDSSGSPINAAWMSSHDAGYLRVDTLTYPTQLYNDLINIKNDIVGTGVPSYIGYWYGIQISQVSSDNGAYGAPMWGNSSVLDFAQSPQCSDVAGSTCSSIAADVTGKLLNTEGIYNAIETYHANQWDTWTNVEFLLGYTYSAYLFSTHYASLLGGHPFVVVPARSYFVPPSQYPYPYNTPSFESLNLLQNYELSVGSSVYGGSSTISSPQVTSDLQGCASQSPYGNLGFWLGLWYVSSGGANPTSYQEQRTSQAAPYYFAHCVAKSIIDVGQFVPSPSSTGWGIYSSFGQVLDRLRNVGDGQYSSPVFTKSDSSTSVTLIGGSGHPLLAWFYTNKSSPEAASLTLSASSYHISPAGWVALSALNWQVVASGSTNTISLSNIPIPAHGWNPIYITNSTSNFGVIYSSLPVLGTGSSSQSVTYDMSGPHRFSSWLVTSSPAAPSSVSSSNYGSISQRSSLNSLNQTAIGERWTGSTWQNMTQTGWFYDSSSGLLYVHYVGDNSVSLTLTYDPSATTTTATTSSNTGGSSTTDTTTTTTTNSTSATTSTASATSTNSTTAVTTTTSSTSGVVSWWTLTTTTNPTITTAASTQSTTAPVEQSATATSSSQTSASATAFPISTYTGIPPSGFSRDGTSQSSQTSSVTYVGGQGESGQGGSGSPSASTAGSSATPYFIFGAFAGVMAILARSAVRARAYKKRY